METISSIQPAPSAMKAQSAPPMSFPVLQLALHLTSPQTGQALRAQDPVFIAVDFEQWEFNQDIITEIGVTVLDTRGLEDLDASEAVSKLNDRMKFAHYRVAEYLKKVNYKFVAGHSENFLFGTSKLIGIKNAGLVLNRIFQDPSELAHAHILKIDIEDKQRNIVLVGHALKNDLSTATKLNWSPQNIIARVDTQVLLASKKRPVSLSNLCKSLDIDAQYLHNAGNDAAYTMQVLVGIVAGETEQPGKVASAVRAIIARK